MVPLTTVRRIGRSENGRKWRSWRSAGVTALLAVLATACTSVLEHPGVTVPCAALRYTVTTNDVEISQSRLDAVSAAVEEFGALVGRPVELVIDEAATAAGNGPGDPVVFELAWPEDDPDGLGFAEPHITGSSFDGGWVMLNPTIRNAPTGLIRRLVLHELGHLHGLAHVDDAGELMDPSLAAGDWGPGDLLGLFTTLDGGCQGSTLLAELLVFVE